MEEGLFEKYKLEKETWTYKGFHGLLHTFFPVGEQPLRFFRKNYGDSFHITIFFVENDYVHWFWNEADMERLRVGLVNRVNRDPAFLSRLLKQWHIKLKLFRTVFKAITTARLAELNDRAFLALYKKFNMAYMDEYSIAVGLQDSFSMHSDRFLEPALKQVIHDHFNDTFVLLMSPTKDSFINQEMLGRYAILIQIQKNASLARLIKAQGARALPAIRQSHKKLYAQLRKHILNFHWVQNNYAKVVYLDAVYFLEALHDMLEKGVNPRVEIKRIEDAIARVKHEKLLLIKKLNLNKELRNLITIAEVFAYMQDERKKYVLIANYYQKLFKDEAGKRLELGVAEMNYTIYPELYDMLLKRGVSSEELHKRKDFCVCIQTLKGYEVVSGKRARELFVRMSGARDKETRILRGQTASVGCVRGIVKIIRTTHDLVNVATRLKLMRTRGKCV